MYWQDTCVVSVDDGHVINDTVDSVVMAFAHDNVNVVGVVMMAFLASWLSSSSMMTSL